MEGFSRKAVDEAGQRFRDFRERPSDLALVQDFRRLRSDTLPNLFQRLAEAIKGQPCSLACRVKRTDTIVRKLRREDAMDLSRMEDIIAFRIIVPTAQVQEQMLEQLQQGLPIHKIRDYRTRPTGAGYRAIHLVLREPATHPGGMTYDYPCEIQLRTYYQHLWATMSESFGEQTKEGGGSAETRSYLQELSECVAGFETNSPTETQVNIEAVDADLNFQVLVFDKKSGLLSLIADRGPDLEGAIAEMLLLEQRYRRDFSRETVLIGVPYDQGAKITHLRYFSHRGIPEIPDVILPKQPRPES
jgi:ppGpp synthetase/RelA/SpoT-type nucleotidyltranferase